RSRRVGADCSTGGPSQCEGGVTFASRARTALVRVAIEVAAEPDEEHGDPEEQVNEPDAPEAPVPAIDAGHDHAAGEGEDDGHPRGVHKEGHGEDHRAQTAEAAGRGKLPEGPG